MTEEQIEQAARLMCREMGDDPDRLVKGDPFYHPKTPDYPAWRSYRHYVQTTYAAMKAIKVVAKEA